MEIKMAQSDKVLTLDDVEEPKPCPFCGKTDMLAITPDDAFYKMYVENGGATINLECERCSLNIWEHSYPGKNYKTKVRWLIKKWNTRKGENNGFEEDQQ